MHDSTTNWISSTLCRTASPEPRNKATLSCLVRRAIALLLDGPVRYGGSNYPADPSNPELAALGGWYANVLILEIPVALSYKLTDHLAIGAAADFGTLSIEWSRAIFVPPNTATVDGRSVSLYPSAVEKRATYGVGAHLGAYYHGDNGIGLGAMVKSPILFPQVSYNATTPAGQADNPDGSVHGLGYQNAWAFSAGVQYELVEKTLMVRAGYNYSTPALSDGDAPFALTAVLLRHVVGGGFTYNVMDHLSISASYVQSFAYPLDSPMRSPLTNQPVSGTSLQLTQGDLAFAGGLAFTYRGEGALRARHRVSGSSS